MSDRRLLEPTEEDGLPADVRQATRFFEAGSILVADSNAEPLHTLLAIIELSCRIQDEAISPDLCRAALWLAVRQFVEDPQHARPPACETCLRPLDETKEVRRRVLQVAGARGIRGRP